MEPNKEILLQKYIDGTATRGEAEEVIKWLSTEEGRFYFEHHFRNDLRSVSDYSETPENEGALWYRLEQSVDNRQGTQQKYKRPSRMFAAFAIAASVLLALSATIFLQQYQAPAGASDEVSGRYIEYRTGADEQQKLTLFDGTLIHMNEHTTLRILDGYSKEHRYVELAGEALFEVEPGGEAFTVLADEVLVEVLGTSFSVNSRYSDKTIVAVQSGVVTLAQLDSSKTDSLQLTENMIGIYNKETSEIRSQYMDVGNYFYWIHGRILFDGIYFEEVLAQLNHIYGFQHHVHNNELKQMRLTAEIADRSAERVLETIAYTLGIDVEISNSVAHWALTDTRNGS